LHADAIQRQLALDLWCRSLRSARLLNSLLIRETLHSPPVRLGHVGEDGGREASVECDLMKEIA